MSVKTVKNAIEIATSNDEPNCTVGAHVDAGEAKTIVAAAERTADGKRKTPVTRGEMKLVRDLFDRRYVDMREPGTMMTMACPESPNKVSMDRGALGTLVSFFRRHDPNSSALLQVQLKELIENFGNGPKLASAPNTSKMVQVFLRDSRPVDGDRLEAFVDLSSRTYFVKSTGAGMGGPETVGPHWYGPNKLDAGLSEARRQQIIDEAQKLVTTGLIEFKPESEALPIGPRFYRAALWNDADAGIADGCEYTALIPSGSADWNRPLTRDPDEAKNFFLEQRGGLFYQVGIAGPFKVENPRK